MDVLRMLNLRATPQRLPADERQVPNSAGGFTYQLDDLARLRRFLTLGVDGGTYYTGAHELALDNAKVLQRLAASDPQGLVETIVDVSVRGAAPKQNPALFAHRLAFGLIAGALVVVTGGLEAGIAAHIVNNIAAYVYAMFSTSVAELKKVTAITWADAAWDIAGFAAFAAAAWWVGTRLRLATRTP